MTMDLATITMPQEQAQTLLDEYQKSWRDTRDEQDRRIAAGYRALANGLTVIKLSESIQRGGFFDNGLPHIAVVRAHENVCSVDVGTSEVIFHGGPAVDWRRNRGALVNNGTVRVRTPGPGWKTGIRRIGQTMVPIIPPRFRPKPHRLHLFHILWEVTEWQLVPPHDPALLRHIGGDLWAVHAVWDLTPLEQAVLGAA